MDDGHYRVFTYVVSLVFILFICLLVAAYIQCKNCDDTSCINNQKTTTQVIKKQPAVDRREEIIWTK